jgi:hypothetical protein
MRKIVVSIVMLFLVFGIFGSNVIGISSVLADGAAYSGPSAGSGSGGVATTTNRPGTETIIYGPKGVSQDSLDKYRSHCASVGGRFNDCESTCDVPSSWDVSDVIGPLPSSPCFSGCDSIRCEYVPKIDKEIEYEYDSDNEKRKYKVKYKDGDEYEIESELKIKDVKEEKIRVEDSHGNIRVVDVLPEDAVNAVFDSDVENVEIKIEEKVHNNVPKVVYKVNAENHNGRFLGIFKMKARYEASVDAITGEVLDWKGPWWAFLITGEPQEPVISQESRYNSESWKEIIPESCEKFYDGCNICKKGGVKCTEKVCIEYERPRCLDEMEVIDFESCVEVTGISTDGIPSECTYEGVTYVEVLEVNIGEMLEAFDFSNIQQGYVFFTFVEGVTKDQAVLILEEYELGLDEKESCSSISDPGQPPQVVDCQTVDSWIDLTNIAKVKVPAGEEKEYAKMLVEKESKIVFAEPVSVVSGNI